VRSGSLVGALYPLLALTPYRSDTDAETVISRVSVEWHRHATCYAVWRLRSRQQPALSRPLRLYEVVKEPIQPEFG